MELKKIWIVVDPSPRSDLDDFIWQQDAEGLGGVIFDRGRGWWKRSHAKLYTSFPLAIDDAQNRLVELVGTGKMSTDRAYELLSPETRRRKFGFSGTTIIRRP